MAGTGAVGFLQGQGVIVNGSELTNPPAATVAVDTGQLIAGNYLFHVTGYSSGDLLYDVQVRDAANAVTVHSFRRRVVAGNSEDFLPGFKIPLTDNERTRAVLVSAVTGTMQLSILYGEISVSIKP